MEDQNFEYEQYSIFRKLSKTILEDLKKHGAKIVAEEINSKNRGEYYVAPTEEGVKDFAKKLK